MSVIRTQPQRCKQVILITKAASNFEQTISTDNGFIFKNISENNKRKKKSQEPFQSYLLSGQADVAKKAGQWLH